MNRSIVFLGFALAALCVYFHRDTITAFPAHIHSWTQSDRYALALRFAEKPNLLLPRTYNLATRDGVTAVDLPLHDWLAGVVMRLLGTNQPWVFRLWTLLLTLAGTFALFRLATRQTGSAWCGMVAALWMFTLPVVVYYQDGFIPSAAGFALLLIACERYFAYRKDARPVHLVQAVILFTLAALPRSPMVMFLVCAAVLEVLSRRLRKEHWSFLAALGVFGVWAIYKRHLAQTYGSQFLTAFTPAGSWDEFWSVTANVWQRWRLQLLTIPHYVLLFGALGLALARRFWRDPEVRDVLLFTGLSFAASGAFYVAMSRQFVDHEYYFLDSFYLPVVLLFAFALKYIPLETGKPRNAMRLACGIVLAAGFNHSSEVQHVKNQTVPHDLAELTRRNFEGAGVWLDSLNIPRDARMLVIDAFTTNIPLIHMRREGWTVLTTSRENIKKAMELPFDYVVLQDFSAASDVLYPYPEITGKLERVAGNGKITLCKRGKSNEHALLGIPAEAVVFTNGFESADSTGKWINIVQDSSRASTGHYAAYMGTQNEFGPGLTLENLPAEARNVYIEASFLTYAVGAPLQMDLTLDHNGERLYYRGQPFKAKAGGHWFRFQVMHLLPDHPDGTTLKVYPWNRDKGDWWVDNLKVTVY